MLMKKITVIAIISKNGKKIVRYSLILRIKNCISLHSNLKNKRRFIYIEEKSVRKQEGSAEEGNCLSLYFQI